MTPFHQPLGAAAWALFRIGRAGVQEVKCTALPRAIKSLQLFLIARDIGQIIQRNGVIGIVF